MYEYGTWHQAFLAGKQASLAKEEEMAQPLRRTVSCTAAANNPPLVTSRSRRKSKSRKPRDRGMEQLVWEEGVFQG